MNDPAAKLLHIISISAPDNNNPKIMPTGVARENVSTSQRQNTWLSGNVRTSEIPRADDAAAFWTATASISVKTSRKEREIPIAIP